MIKLNILFGAKIIHISMSHSQLKVQSVIINNYTLKLKACATPRTFETISVMGSIIWLFLLANGKNHSFRNGVCTCFRAQTSKLKCSICPVRSIFFMQNADFFTENKQTGQLIFFVFGQIDQKTKSEKMEWSQHKIFFNSMWE